MAIDQFTFLLLLLLIVSQVIATSSSMAFAGATHYHNFYVKNATYTRLCESKSILTVNGLFPGPTLYFHKGDKAIINVYNEAPYNVTLHWHGLRQPRNPWSDGPEYITQCGIQPGANFTYTLILSTEEGTLWYHAHSDWTRATVHGAMVIYPKPGTTYPFPKPDKDLVLVIGEWWKSDVMEVMQEALSSGAEFNTSDAFTINGQPGDLYSCSKEGTFNVEFEQGKTYHLRLVNAAMSTGHFFGIANHTLTVVTRDAAYLKPFNRSYVLISPGQTMDMLVKGDQCQGLYYMAASPYAPAVGVTFDNTTATAIIRYKGLNITSLPSVTPSFPSLPLYNDSAAVLEYVKEQKSLASKEHPIDVPMEITRRFVFVASVNELACPNNSCAGPNGTRLSASMNNISFVTPKIDILEAYYNNIKNVYTTNFPTFPPEIYNFTASSFPDNVIFPTQGTRVKVLNYNDTVELVYQGTNVLAGENHPMHLHGHSFYVLARDFGNFDPVNDPLKYNLVDPPKENTVGLPINGWVTVRFKASNPGVWLLHCHLERHFSWGMIAVFIVKDGPTPETSILPPPPYMPPC